MGNATTPATTESSFGLGEAAMGLSALSAGMQIGSSIYSSKIQKTTLQSQAKIDAINAKMADEASKYAMFSGKRQEQAYKMQAAANKGSARATMAARGVDLSSETAQAAFTSMDYITASDVNTIRLNAFNEAFGYKTNALNKINSSVANKIAAGSISPAMSGVSSLLLGATSVAKDYYLYNSYKSK